MKLKELQTKYQEIELFENKEGLNFFSPPQILKKEIAFERYGDKKVLYFEEHDDRKTTEILIEP